MEKRTVYLKEYIFEGAVEELKKKYNVVSDFENLDVIEGIITRGEDINRELISSLPNLKVIGKHGVGVETIDLKAAEDHGVTVVFTPGCNSHSVAELSIALLLDVCRKVTLSMNKVKEGEVDDIAPKEYTGIELSGRTMGYVGLGRVAQESAAVLKGGFGMTLLGYDPFLPNEVYEKYGVEKTEDLNDIFRKSDFVHISIPLTEDTRGLVGEEQIRLMKSTAVLINTSRGFIVDEKALYDALKERRIYGAGSDVFDTEPVPADEPLLQLDNFVGTPHIGACTEEAMIRMGNTVVQEVMTVLEGGTPRFPVKR